MNADPIRDFMSRVVPWPKTDEPGYINLHTHLPRGPFDGVSVQTVDAFLREVEKAQPRNRNIYFCLSQQREPGARNQLNALLLRAIWIDLDVGPDKPYKTSKQALTEFKRFLDETGLPKPSQMVASGSGGFHVYWFSKTKLIPGVWQMYAEALKALMVRHHLQTDLGSTADSARVLRVPGTLNWKHNPPKPVMLMPLDGTEYDLSTIKALQGVAPVSARNGSLSSRGPLPPLPERFNGKEIARIIVKDDDLPPAQGPMPAEQLRQCLDLIPNDKENWDRWNTIGMRIYAACDGEDYGCEEWQRWSDKLNTKGKDSCEERWNTYHTSPPTRTGAGALVNEVRRITGNDRWLPLRPGLRPAVDGAFDLGHPITIESSPEAAPIAWSAAELKVSFSNVPHRQWLYGIDLVRGEITVQGAPGGAGKTSLAIGMAVSIATGRPLLGETIWGADNLKALYINAEDSGTEMQRRVWAFCLKHGIPEQELDRLYVAGTDDVRVQALSFLRPTEKNSFVLDQSGFNRLEELVGSLRPDLVVIDPLVALCGGGNINDNGAMSLVIRELKRLAIKFECAILIIHHTRKGAEPGSAEAISGAAAIVNLARRAIMPVTMTETEATKLRVWPSKRHAYFKVVDAKSNLAPRSDDTPWYQLDNIILPNAEPPTYKLGDGVQAVERVQLPLLNNGVASAEEQIICHAILDTVDRGKTIDAKVYPYSPNVAGAKNERTLIDDAMAAVEKATGRTWHPGDLQAAVKRTTESLKSDKWLVIGDPIKGKDRFRRGSTLRVDWSRTPWAEAHRAPATHTMQTRTDETAASIKD
jgi:hypothetical protein